MSNCYMLNKSNSDEGGVWLGQAPEMANYYVAAGMRSSGIASAGGVGTVIAHWIVKVCTVFS